MANIYQIVERTQASKWKRLVNYIIDLIVAYLIVFVFWILMFMLIKVDPTNINSLIDRGSTLIIYFLSIFATEALTKGRSLGKIITGTRVIKSNGGELTVTDYFIRNIIRLVVIVDQLSFLGNLGYHDSWSNTRVVNKYEFEREMSRVTEIDEIGKNIE